MKNVDPSFSHIRIRLSTLKEIDRQRRVKESREECILRVCCGEDGNKNDA